jgi:hypothetical protein
MPATTSARAKSSVSSHPDRFKEKRISRGSAASADHPHCPALASVGAVVRHDGIRVQGGSRMEELGDRHEWERARQPSWC